MTNEARLEERLDSGNGRGSAIVITVENSTEASRLCSKRLRFGGALKVVEKYWEAEPSSICISCVGIRHDRLGGFGERKVQCVICAGAHKFESHKWRVTGRNTKIGKICTHIIPKFANCGENHQATAFKCPAKLNVQTEAWKKKMEKPQLGETLPVANDSYDKRPTSRQIDMDVDTEVINWAKSLNKQSSGLSSRNGDLSEEAQDKF